MQALQRWRWPAMRLSARFVLASLALLLVVQAAGFLVIRHSIQRNAHAQLDEHVTIAGQVWQRLLDQRAAKLNQGAALLAADYGMREAVSSGDLETVRSALDNHGARIGASLAALLGTDLAIKAVAEGVDPMLGPALATLAPQLAQHPGSGLVGLVAQRPYQFVMVPMRAPTLIGWVVMGFPLNQPLLDDIHAVSGMHAALVAQPVGGAPLVLVHSLKPPADASPLANQLADGDLLLGAEPYLVATTPVASGPEGRIILRLAGSIAAAVAPYDGLQWMLAAITLLGVVAFGVGSMWTAGRVTKPLRRLVRASERLGRGEYDEPVAQDRRLDEIGDLARAFDHMRVNVGAQREQIRTLAYRDRLTGLPNRLQFRDDVQRAIAQADAATDHLAVLMLDLDRFKHVNDVLGYASGDRLLAGVATRLQEVVRDGDVVARLGGDEFALLMHAADVDLAVAVAQRITTAFEQPLLLDDHTVDLSAGLGIAVWPLHAADADALLSRAEVAMYAAKRRTAGAQVYDPAVDTASALNLSLLSELRRAVDNHELRLYLQPKIAIQTGSVCGAEALVRWQHPTRGLVPPMQFIPFAEQTGFIRQLTLWMFEQAAAQQVALAVLGVRRVSVNLSTRDLLDLELPEKLDAILRRHRALADGFCLEITESAIMDDPQRAESTLNRLAERGYKLSIDDFGTGYSSLAYLKKLPVNELKIDKSFVMAMEKDAGDAKIVRSTIDLAHNLGLTVVAEGVENAAVLALLHELQCDEGQGYHMSKPLPIDDFCDWVARWQARPPAAPGLATELRAGAPLLH
ncbi:putative bifunctional diguanylate cyclase/phosphodiesterase [Pseudaquabacterium pictum]|nr:EAL domain-containing protein [Rubrivivax pictus]